MEQKRTKLYPAYPPRFFRERTAHLNTGLGDDTKITNINSSLSSFYFLEPGLQNKGEIVVQW